MPSAAMLSATATAPAAPTTNRPPVQWRTLGGQQPYPETVAAMEAHVAGISAGQSPEAVWLLEHPPLYTAGTSAQAAAEVLPGAALPVYASGRGGRMTYHGPGQRIAYVLLDLKRQYPDGPDVRRYVADLERWIMLALASLGVQAGIRAGRVGVWTVDGAGNEAKIAALGIRVRRWVAFHGVAVNVCPDLAAFRGIIPCGIQEYGVTSLQALGVHASMATVDAALKDAFTQVFGR